MTVQSGEERTEAPIRILVLGKQDPNAAPAKRLGQACGIIHVVLGGYRSKRAERLVEDDGRIRTGLDAYDAIMAGLPTVISSGVRTTMAGTDVIGWAFSGRGDTVG